MWMVSDTLTVADIRAAAAVLDQQAVPTMDGYYVVHIAPVQARALREAAIDAELRPARDFASWHAVAGENERLILQTGAVIHAGYGDITLTADDIADAIGRLWDRWRVVAGQRRRARKARRGW